jgi:hypothetical protein
MYFILVNRSAGSANFRASSAFPPANATTLSKPLAASHPVKLATQRPKDRLWSGRINMDPCTGLAVSTKPPSFLTIFTYIDVFFIT